ncbi:hypothetical protein FOL47_000057 [Perkinsus chesapeaki]|uniref:Uncharacterized protein n=1 Tax=Perkinsus chesapeaki TaxID=330153 RepID=A0A7J6N331_PERCH|nr:hypothetical protein FOL47_000057 [Perkinsus chesapeaki]
MSSATLPSVRPLTIATHSGKFHCDEVLGTVMLDKILGGDKNYKLVRTRNPDIINKADVVIDVGAEFDPARCRFDHHQRTFTEKFDTEDRVSKLSSAGLVYKYFGREMLRTVYGVAEDRKLDILYRKLYNDFIESVDAIDNGVPIAEEAARYRVFTDLASRVSRKNPRWNEPEVNAEIEAQRFRQAMAICEEELSAQIETILLSFLPAREIVEEAIAKRFEVHPSGRVIHLSHGCPFAEHLYDIEREKGLATEASKNGDATKRKADSSSILYVIYADATGGYRVQAVGVEGHNFLSRKPLPSRFRGVRDEDLSKVAGVDDLIFVHASGFIGGAKTYESAVKLADLSIVEDDDEGKMHLLKKCKRTGK